MHDGRWYCKKSILNKRKKFIRRLTPIVASQRVRKGVCTVAVICPAAATIRLIAISTSGCEVRSSYKDVGSKGASNEEKSVVDIQALEGSVGTECEVFTIKGDGGGEAYACKFDCDVFCPASGIAVSLSGVQV